MKRLGRLTLFGFLTWMATFAGAMLLSPLRESERQLFETLMISVLTLSTVVFALLYFRGVKSAYLKEGVLLGISFVACNILFDLPMFMAGPMEMLLVDYMKDIGLAYFSMPIICVGFGYALQHYSTMNDTA